jgi:hypothetical protein
MIENCEKRALRRRADRALITGMSYDSLDKQAAGASGPSTARLRAASSGLDPRLQRGAYVTDGINLYEVTAITRGPGVMGLTTVRVEIENCCSFVRIELLPEKIQRSFSLVRPGPGADCPDLVDDIAWS